MSEKLTREQINHAIDQLGFGNGIGLLSAVASAYYSGARVMLTFLPDSGEPVTYTAILPRQAPPPHPADAQRDESGVCRVCGSQGPYHRPDCKHCRDTQDGVL